MIKRLLLGLGISGMLLTLAACQPKEEPKELVQMALTNTIKTSGFNIRSSGNFNVDFGSAAEGEVKELGLDKKMKINYAIKGAIDFTKKQAEQRFSLTFPYNSHSYTFKTNVHLNEKEKQLAIDNNSLLNAVHTMWDIIQGQQLIGKLTNEQKTDITHVISYLDLKLKNTNTLFNTNDMYTSSPTKEMKKEAGQLKRILNWIPKEAYSYSKDKKGHYGHILISLTDTQTKEVIESVIKETYKVDKKIGHEKEQKQALKDHLNFFKEESKIMKFKKVHLSILVNEQKQIVDVNSDISLEIDLEDNKNKPFKYSFTNHLTFSHYGKPMFYLPIKSNKNLSLEEVVSIVNSKMNQITAKYMQTNE